MNLELTHEITPDPGDAVNICTGKESMIVRNNRSEGGGISVWVTEGVRPPTSGNLDRPWTIGAVAAGRVWKVELKSAPYE